MTSPNEIELLNSLRDRADALAGELDDAKQRLATLEAGKGAAMPPVRPASMASVTHPPTEILLDPRMPSDADLLSLLSIVRRDYPSLSEDGWAPRRAMEEYRKDFIAFKIAFRWQLDIGRGNLNMSRTANLWADRVQGFALFHGIKNVLIGGNQLLCACVATNDVTFLNPREYPRNLMHVGLREGYGGQPADAQAWCRVLSTGKAPPASNYRPREYAKGTVVIRCAR